MEAYAFLVGAPVFKTGEVEYLGLAGSIPVRLRQFHQFRNGSTRPTTPGTTMQAARGQGRIVR